MNERYKIIGFLKRSSNNAVMLILRICKPFVKSHLDFSDIVYDKPNNESFTSNLERVQYKTCLAITRYIL